MSQALLVIAIIPLLYIILVLLVSLGSYGSSGEFKFLWDLGISESTKKMSVPGLTVDDVELKVPGDKSGGSNVERYRERYDLRELSSKIQIRVNWTNDDGWDDVTNLYFRRTHGSITKETEASANQRRSNSSHQIILTPKANENMLGNHTIEILYKLMGSDTKTLLTTINTTVTEDQITLALESLQPTPLTFSLPDFQSDDARASVWSSEQNFVRLSPNPNGFGTIQFIPSDTGIKIKRITDNKFLKVNNINKATWVSSLSEARTFYLGLFEDINKYRIGMDSEHNNNTRYLIKKPTPEFTKKKDIRIGDNNLFTISEVTVDELVCETDFPSEQARTDHMTGQIGEVVSDVLDSLEPYPNDQALFNEFLETRSNLIGLDDTFTGTHLAAFGMVIASICN